MIVSKSLHGHIHSFLSDELRNGMTGSYGRYFLTFNHIIKLPSKVIVPFKFPPTVYENSGSYK